MEHILHGLLLGRLPALIINIARNNRSSLINLVISDEEKKSSSIGTNSVGSTSASWSKVVLLLVLRRDWRDPLTSLQNKKVLRSRKLPLAELAESCQYFNESTVKFVFESFFDYRILLSIVRTFLH